MKKYLALIPALFILLFGFGAHALASDTSHALWSGIVRVTNNSTVATGVSVNFSANTTNYIAGGFMYSSGNNTAIQFTSTDVAYMPGYAGNPWIVFQSTSPANSITDGTLYMGGTADMTAKIRYFPTTAGANVTDSATMATGGNYSVQIDDVYLSSSANLSIKPLVYALTYDSTSSNVTLKYAQTIAPPNYTEQDAGGYIAESGGNVTYTNMPSVTDTYLYYDFGAGYFNAFDVTWYQYVAGQAVNPLGHAGVAFTNTLQDIAGLAATDVWAVMQSKSAVNAQYRLGRGNFVANSDSGDKADADKLMKIRLWRAAGSDSANMTIYNSATDAQLYSLTLAGLGAGTTYRYFMANINFNDGTAGRLINGSTAGIMFTTPSTLLLTKNTTTGEHDINVTDNATNLALSIDSGAAATTSQMINTTSTAMTMTWAQGVAYTGNMSISVGGNYKGFWNWDYATTFTDESGNGNTMTPSFRTTSSDSDVSAELIDFHPIEEADAPPYTVTDPPPLITANISVSGGFTSNVSGSTAPGIAVISAAATASGTPVPFVLYLICGTVLVGGSFGISWLMRDGGSTSLVVKLLLILGALGVLIALNIFDDWVLYLFAMLGVGIAFIASNRQFEGTGNFNNNLLGFLIMSWLGLMMINNILEGVILTGTERSMMNNFLMFQPWNVANLFTLPVPSISFLTVGLPALMEWDYTAFGGNAQIFTYLMYSISGVVAFLFFTVAMASAANMFFRSR